MNKQSRTLQIIFLYIVVAQISIFSSEILPNFYDNVPNETLASLIIDNMTDEELLAQTLMFSWKGQEPKDRIIDWVKNTGLGGIKLFGWNTGNSLTVAKSIITLQQQALKRRFSIPLFVATDQEGGWVRHVKGKTSKTPGNLAIGASGLPIDAYYSGYYISRELRALGININFAPTVDLLTQHQSKIIGTRAFSDNPKIASILGLAFMKGSHDAGLLTTAKHFPGHGDTIVDSHGRIPQINISKNDLKNRELIPFQYMIDAGVPAVMAGHLNFPQILKDGKPASFSKYILQDILRDEMGFKGLIITDDMMMTGAINFAGSLKEAFRQALLAGNNIVESSKTPTKEEAVWYENLEYLKTNNEFKNCVKNSAYRVVLSKLNYFKSKKHVPIFPNLEKITQEVPNKNAKAFFQSLASRSVTLVRNKNIPFKAKDNDKILLVSDYNNFFGCALQRFPKSDTIKTASAILFAKKYNTIIFCLANNYSLKNLQKLIIKYPNKKYFVISILSPHFLNSVPQIKNAIAVYSTADESLKAAFSALCGDFVPKGKMPIQGVK